MESDGGSTSSASFGSVADAAAPEPKKDMTRGRGCAKDAVTTPASQDGKTGRMITNLF